MDDVFERPDGHHAVEMLLPWYATAQLDPSDTALVAAHLAGCADCRAMLVAEHGLRRDVADLSPRTSADWAVFESRLDPTMRRSPNRRPLPGRAIWRPARIGRAFAAPLAAAAAAVLAVTLTMPRNPAPYRTLSAASATSAGNLPVGNLIVMFRPDTTEERLRAALRISGARLVDGPTTANAYVLIVPGNQRLAALAQLRAQPAVTLAEPIDAAPAP